MFIVLHFNPLRFFYIRCLETTARGPNPGCEAIHPACKTILQLQFADQIRPENTFCINNEKLIDEKLFHLVECDISRNNSIT